MRLAYEHLDEKLAELAKIADVDAQQHNAWETALESALNLRTAYAQEQKEENGELVIVKKLVGRPAALDPRENNHLKQMLAAWYTSQIGYSAEARQLSLRDVADTLLLQPMEGEQMYADAGAAHQRKVYLLLLLPYIAALEGDVRFTLRCGSEVSHMRTHGSSVLFQVAPVLPEVYEEDAQLLQPAPQQARKPCGEEASRGGGKRDAAAVVDELPGAKGGAASKKRAAASEVDGGKPVSVAVASESPSTGNDAAGSLLEHDYDYALVTVPLGVLQQPDFFAEAGRAAMLPESKRNAIARLRMGLELRVFLAFHQRLWPETASQLREAYGSGTLDDAEPWRFYCHDRALSEPAVIHILVACASPRHAKEIMNSTEEQLVDNALATLQRMLGDGVRTAVHSAFASHWHRDPFSRGAYSFIPAGAGQADVQALAAPAHPLYFAGEATHYRYMSYAVGAMESGETAAQQIMYVYAPLMQAQQAAV